MDHALFFETVQCLLWQWEFNLLAMGGWPGPLPPVPLIPSVPTLASFHARPPLGTSLRLLFLLFLTWWPLHSILSALSLIPAFLILKFTWLPLALIVLIIVFAYWSVSGLSAHTVLEGKAVMFCHFTMEFSVSRTVLAVSGQ